MLLGLALHIHISASNKKTCCNQLTIQSNIINKPVAIMALDLTPKNRPTTLSVHYFEP